MCVRDCVGGEREAASEREGVGRGRGREGGRISGGEDARWECVADQRAEGETSRCSAEGKQQVSRLTAESVNGDTSSRRREERGEERRETQRLHWGGEAVAHPSHRRSRCRRCCCCLDSGCGESKLTTVLLPCRTPGHPDLTLLPIGVAPGDPAGEGYVICFGVRV